jgi:hypothetical protein
MYNNVPSAVIVPALDSEKLRHSPKSPENNKKEIRNLKALSFN